MIRAGRVARSRNGHAFISRDGNPGKLRDDPTIGELIVQHHRIAVAVEFTNTTEAGPDGGDAGWSKQRSTGCFIEDLEAFVDHLHVLSRADLNVRIRWRAVDGDAGNG